MVRISSREYDSVKPFLFRAFSTSKSYEFFKRYEKDILANLPDIDRKEQREVEASEEFAKDLMTGWRVYTSLADSISDLIVNRKIPEDELDAAFKAVEDLRRMASQYLDDAQELALRAYTIKNYGLKLHTTTAEYESLKVYAFDEIILPLSVITIATFLLLNRFKG